MSETSKQVSKSEFEDFIKEYPNPLDVDIARMFEPPIKTYNDFTSGKGWPQSSIAFVKLYDGSDYHSGRTEEYYIFQPTTK